MNRIQAKRARAPAPKAPLEPIKIRRDFPILHRTIHGKPLVYLDNAASTQKPLHVINSIRHTYETEYANIHRGVHLLSQLATDAYEAARKKVQTFIHAESDKEIVFTRGTTEAINLVAQSYLRPRLRAGDEIIITHMEHHSNIVPWQILCEQTGAKLRIAPINDRGELVLEEFENLLSERIKLVSVAHVSNALGTINPISRIIELSHAHGVPVLVDGAQSIPHIRVDVQELGCDFFAFSGHKIYGPTGIGALYARMDHLNAMPPYQGGGDMILAVSFEKTIYNEPPFKFEAGTPHIAGGIALGAALDYVDAIGLDAISAHEQRLLTYATERLESIPGVRIIGTAEEKAAVISFTIKGIHPHDIGSILDHEGIAIRTGHHCAQPVMQHFSLPATARASFAVYNTLDEADVLAQGIEKVIEVFH